MPLETLYPTISEQIVPPMAVAEAQGVILYFCCCCCLDTDECIHDICDHTCVNKPGTYSCVCRDGYYLYQHDARSCYKYNCVPGGDGCGCQLLNGVCGLDEDECSTGNHICAQECVNTNGSYDCACGEGYQQLGKISCQGKELILHIY